MKSKIFLLVIAGLFFFNFSVKADKYLCGNLDADVTASSENVYVTCPTFSNGYDISIYNCNVYFSEEAYLYIENEDVLDVDFGESAVRNLMTGYEDAYWFGIITEKGYISIKHTDFYNVVRDQGTNLKYTIAGYSPRTFTFSDCTINPVSSTSTSAYGIVLLYSEFYHMYYTPSVDINNSYIGVNGSLASAVNLEYGYGQTPNGSFSMTGNHFRHTVGGAVGVYYVGILNGEFENNIFTDFGTGIYGFSSTADVYQNEFTSTANGGQIKSVSTALLSLNYPQGENEFTVSSGPCVLLVGGDFDIQNGNNSFTNNDYPASKYFEGFFSSAVTPANPFPQQCNSYFSSGATPVSPGDAATYATDVTFSNNAIVYFDLYCPDAQQKQISKNSITADLYLGIKTGMKAKDYKTVSQKCKELLLVENSGMKALDALRKLFTATSQLYIQKDIPASVKIKEFTELKKFYENFLAVNLTNNEVTEEANFLLQDCKIVTGEYHSALQGYYNLMNKSSKKMMAKWAYEGLKTYMVSQKMSGISSAMTQKELIAMRLEDVNNLVNSENQNYSFSNKSFSTTPVQFELNQNYPNPFNPVTNIQFSLPKESFVSLKVYDVVGRMVKELVSEFKREGNYSVTFDGSNLSSGIYFYRLESNNFVDTKRMILVK